MEKTRRNVRYLYFHKIVHINYEQIKRYGGFCPERPLNPDSLHYLVEIVQTKLFGQEFYPSLFEKAAVYAHHIITKHIFWDGNHRTGMACAFYFLRLNGYYPAKAITDDEIIDIADKIGQGTADLNYIVQWLEEKFVEIK